MDDLREQVSEIASVLAKHQVDEVRALTKNTKITLGSAAAILLCVVSFLGYAWKQQEAVRVEQQTIREEARVERQALAKELISLKESVLVLQQDVLHLRKSVDGSVDVMLDRWTRTMMREWVRAANDALAPLNIRLPLPS